MSKKRKQQIEAKKLEIERRGGIVGISPDSPDWLVEQFLDSVLACPDCRTGAARQRERSH